MRFREKIFVNKELSDDEIAFVVKTLETIDLDSHLKDCFSYISVYDNGVLEISSIKDDDVYLTSMEYNITNKMSMEYLKQRVEIEQKVNEALYWVNINSMKKYVPVIADDGKSVTYADFNIYSPSIERAIRALNEMNFDDYLYLVDVDEEV